MIGEVWVCSGQSNMEWSYLNGLKDVRDELPTCYNTNIRFFNIPKTTANHPQDDVKGRLEGLRFKLSKIFQRSWLFLWQKNK
jgi:sialate O-acetylesterase